MTMLVQNHILIWSFPMLIFQGHRTKHLLCYFPACFGISGIPPFCELEVHVPVKEYFVASSPMDTFRSYDFLQHSDVTRSVSPNVVPS